jgi:hypothetical protein
LQIHRQPFNTRKRIGNFASRIPPLRTSTFPRHPTSDSRRKTADGSRRRQTAGRTSADEYASKSSPRSPSPPLLENSWSASCNTRDGKAQRGKRREQRAESRERRAESREQRTENREERGERREEKEVSDTLLRYTEPVVFRCKNE